MSTSPNKQKNDRLEALRSYRPPHIQFGTDEGVHGERRPAYDVGEFLPSLGEDVAVIARINLASTTGDVYAIHLRREEEGYTLSVVDEYETEFYGFKEEYDEYPTQGELVQVLINMEDDNNGIPHLLSIAEYGELESIDAFFDFVHFDSILYPNLEELYTVYLRESGFN